MVRCELPWSGTLAVMTASTKTTTGAAASLRRLLLAWLLAPLVLWSLVSAVVAYVLALYFTTDAYDHSLRASIRDLERQLRTVDGHIVVDLPPQALEMLEWNEADRVYYRVMSASGRYIAGDPSLPEPPVPATTRTRYFDASFRGVEVRVAATRVARPGAEPVFVEVAETTDARRSITGEISLAALGLGALLVGLASVGVWLGIGKGLAPIDRLRLEIERRSDEDLSPLDPARAPTEVRPLVDAINALLARLGSALAAHRRFVANAAHQLRTPLAGLRTQAELGVLETEPNAVRQCLDQVRQAAERATHLVNQLLSLARLEPRGGRPLQAEPIDLGELVRSVTARWVPQALKAGIDLGYEGGPNQRRVLGDRLLIEEMLGNLIDNAIRYVPAGGFATVRVEHAPGAVVLIVEDNGPGIPEAERDQVLERFQRGSTAGQRSGSGLGLSIVREIADTHGAVLRLESTDGERGVRVRLSFPTDD